MRQSIKASKAVKLVAKAIRVVKREIKIQFAAYLVLDTYGSRIYCWTLAEAYSWGSALANGAVLLDRKQKKCIGRLVNKQGSLVAYWVGE